MVRRLIRFLLGSIVLVLTVTVALPVAVGATVLGAFLFLPLPAVIPQPKVAAVIAPTEVYDRDGNLIAEFRQFDQNIPVSRADIPQVLKEAVISVEDRNFYQHGGIDLRGSVRAFVADLRSQKAVQGGSTITQQYVKMAYTGSQRTLVRKVHEAIIASQLDRQTSKDEILYRYLSAIYLGDGSYGVGAAAENYFRVPVSQLTLSEAAMLAGIIAAPSAWAPRENPEAADLHREAVLDKMLEQGYITPLAHDRAMAQKVWLLAKGAAPALATPVFPPQQVQPRYPAFTDYVERWLINRFGPDLVYRGGLQVQTTLDPAVQAAADQSVQHALAGTAEPLEMALASVEPQTGFVAAIVGGRQFGQGPYASLNLALGGCEPRPAASVTVEVAATCWDGSSITGGGVGRQPGSAWKPFVLATAFAAGVRPDKVYPAPHSLPVPGCQPAGSAKCTIGNNEGEGGGTSDLRHATWNSVNTVFAELIRDVGCPATATTAKRLGIESAWYSAQVQTCSGAYALGEIGVSPLDMASAYGVFDTHGLRAEPTPVLKVLDAAGHTLVNNIATAPPTTAVMAPVVADNVTDVLRGVITDGTGTAAKLGRPAAGKTGTTSNFTNAWFVGYTPTLSTAVWMGDADNESTPLRNIKGVPEVFGGTIPAATWKAFMTQALADVPATDFSQPAPIAPPPEIVTPVTPRTIGPGGQRPEGTTPPGGPYLFPPPKPKAVLPEATTTTSAPPATSTFGGPIPPGGSTPPDTHAPPGPSPGGGGGAGAGQPPLVGAG